MCDASEAVIVSPLTIDYTPLLLLLPLHSPVLHLSVCLSVTDVTHVSGAEAGNDADVSVTRPLAAEPALARTAAKAPHGKPRHHPQTAPTTAEGTPFSGSTNTALCDF